MDDLEFRRRVMSEPKQKSGEYSDALSKEANQKFLDDVLKLDAQIADAMKVDVPEGLADRILFNQSSHADNVTTVNFARKAMAMAASIAFVFGLVVGQVNWGKLIVPPAQASLVDIAIKHVVDEEGFVSNIDEQVSSRQINAKLLPFAYKFAENFPYHVYYLNHCGFGQSNALHMVFQGEHGKVTLFLAGVQSDINGHFNKDGMSGMVESVGDKSLIIVGNSNENIGKIADNLLPLLTPQK
ncbi:DUF3379 domain-containing protein [Vibrio diazotrophicus]|uniref:DUF3379 domain-containing protein n=1 Tax=Vibrio diazotrophicus TaxID=685 RepID=UPI00142DA189|nr:DUF3379 domain-containing protein [Vibrio diazotrophicus]NIY91427.1 DUF3379 domain-containing protein [Vibrio diazotrophicus]